MAGADDLRTAVALRIHDASKAELSDANLIIVANMAVDDLTVEGIVLPLAEDESLEFAADTYAYSVPATFAYIKELREETAISSGLYPQVIHPTLWRLTIETGTTPIIQFDSTEYDLPAATINLKVVGQQRVAQLSGSDTVPPGLEAFIRERSVAYAADILAGGVSELSVWRRGAAEQAWARSLDILRRIPREFRPWPDSRRVPER